MLKILITGGAGYIGSVLTGSLLSRGFPVTVLDNMMRGGEALMPLMRFKNLTVIEGDIRDNETVTSAVKGMDLIVHLAALVGYPTCESYPDEAEAINVRGSMLLNEARGKGVPVIYSSTGSVYGLQNSECDEDTVPNPTSLYAASKLKGEEIFLKSGNATALRFATGFGISLKMRHDLLINSFVREVVASKRLVIYEKDAFRSFIHINDIVRCIEFAIHDFERVRDQVFNVGDEALTLKKGELAELISSLTDGTTSFSECGSDMDSRNYRMSFEKIKRAGFRTAVSLRSGIEEMIRLYTVFGKRLNSSDCIDLAILRTTRKT